MTVTNTNMSKPNQSFLISGLNHSYVEISFFLKFLMIRFLDFQNGMFYIE